MRIAFVVRRFSFSDWGGTEQVVWRTAQELQRMGHTVDILATAAMATVGEEVRDGIAIQRFPYFYPRFPTTKARALNLDGKNGDPFAFKLLQKLRTGHYDLIHLHTLGHLANQSIAIAHRLKIPAVISLHGGHLDVPEVERSGWKSSTRGTFNYGKLWAILRGENGNPLSKCDGIICVGEREAEMQMARYPNQSVLYLPNGVDVSRFATRAQWNLREAQGWPKDARILLCVSRLDPQKNQKLLIDVFARIHRDFPKVVLLMVGPVTLQDYYAELQSQIDTLQIADAVRIIPGLASDSDELLACYQNAEIFVLPSRHEPFGIVALEAWAAHVPVVASDVGGLSRLITDHENGLLFKTEDELEHQLRTLLNNPESAQYLVQNADEIVREKYGFRQVVARCLAFYEEVRHG